MAIDSDGALAVTYPTQVRQVGPVRGGTIDGGFGVPGLSVHGLAGDCA
jgi:hypothetical protein